ncbi:hypothetical protein BBK82_37765 [Lentzea guizhouensis]|uniref:Uncharacterized protein n=1 Tax=Lentzea guizhouensis TaxID=1586287 RepID=A0A1B2HT63_9PSEU|nr:hypothetical protein BBK82_37765 [Lentzea guizhouensis]
MAHPGGLLVRRPELTVGVVRATSWLSAFEVELLARRPLDRRDTTERQRDIRAGGPVQPAPRRLLPAYDEGLDLRVARLDETGHAHWEFAISGSSGSGDHFGGTSGPSHRALFRFPPTFDEMSLVLAWPEIGFPETVLTVPLPDRTTVEQTTTSIWRAPLDVRPVPEGLTHHVDRGHDPPAIEAGTIAAPPRVLHRRDHRAAVVLTRLTAVDSLLSLELHCVATGHLADVVNENAFPSAPPVRDPVNIRTRGPGASVAVVRGHEAHWIRHGGGVASGGDQRFSSLRELTVQRPEDDVLDLVVAWPLAGLDDVRVRIPLGSA